MNHRYSAFITIALTLAANDTTAHAATINWNPGNGQWNDAANWSPAQIPTALDDVFIDNNTTATASSVNAHNDADANTITLDPDDTFFLSGTATLTTNAIHANGPNGASAPILTATPGAPGANGATIAFLNNASLSTPTLNLSGGNGGNGGSFLASAGSGGQGGNAGAFLPASATTFANLTLDLTGGNGGNGGPTINANAAHGGHAGHGASIDIAPPAIITFDNATLDLSGGNGGNGGSDTAVSAGFSDGGNAGNAGNAGNLTINGGDLTLIATNLTMNAGTPGTPGTTGAIFGDPGSPGAPGTAGQVVLNSGTLTLKDFSAIPNDSLALNGGTVVFDNTGYDPLDATLDLATNAILKNTNIFIATNLHTTDTLTFDTATQNIPGTLQAVPTTSAINIINGSLVTTDTLELGGTLTIDGPGAILNTNTFNGLDERNETLIISNGATLNTNTTFFDEGGTITLQDPTSTWNNTTSFSLLDVNMTIANAAQASSASTALRQSRVTVRNPGTTWSPGTLTLFTNGDFTIQNGASLITNAANALSEASEVTVTGPGTTWTDTTGTIRFGDRNPFFLNDNALAEFAGQLRMEDRSRLNLNNATLRTNTIAFRNDNEGPNDPISTLNWTSGLIHLTNPATPTHIGQVGFGLSPNQFPGRLILAPGMTLMADAGTTVDDTPARFQLTGGTLITPSLTLPEHGVFIYTAGTLHLTGPDPAHIGPDPAASPPNTITPTITLNPTDNLFTDGGTQLSPDGTLILDGGTLRTAFLTRDAGSTFNFNTGTLHLTGPTPVHIGGTQTDPNHLPPLTTLSPDQTLIADTTVNVLSASNLIIAGGTYTAQATTINTGANLSHIIGEFNSNSILAAGNVELSPGTTTNITPGTLLITATGTFSADGNLNAQAASNEGTLNTFAGSLNFAGNATNDIGAQINAINATITFPANDLPDEIGLTNLGTLNLINTTINGDVRSPAGTLINVAGAVAFNGFFSGAATFPGAGSVIFNGGFSPGDSPAAITFQNDLTLGPANNLILELAEGDSGGHDQLNITGTLHAAGQLTIELLDGYHPTPGETFQLLDFASTTGQFSQINLPLGYRFDTTQLLTTGHLTIIPEPATLSLCYLLALVIRPTRRLLSQKDDPS